jgi:hypothetical protein
LTSPPASLPERRRWGPYSTERRASAWTMSKEPTKKQKRGKKGKKPHRDTRA